VATGLQIGSVKTWLFFGCFIVIFGLLVALDKGSGAIDRALHLGWLAFLVAGSVIVGVRMWTARKHPGEFRRLAHGAKSASCRPSGQRWVLAEDDQRRNQASDGV
jgi:hypothetical protein